MQRIIPDHYYVMWRRLAVHTASVEEVALVLWRRKHLPATTCLRRRYLADCSKSSRTRGISGGLRPRCWPFLLPDAMLGATRPQVRVSMEPANSNLDDLMLVRRILENASGLGVRFVASSVFGSGPGRSSCSAARHTRRSLPASCSRSRPQQPRGAARSRSGSVSVRVGLAAVEAKVLLVWVGGLA